ncbi:MAG: FecR domain-containing protein [Burkholderiales bacterium]|nr:FecR domain-containing protein [Burkholderiales bacterium]
MINVARDSWAILEFNDQTRITLRPNTVFRLDSYKADAPEAMLLGLVKGGLRVVTGLLGKRNPSGVKVQTAVATIGIRGTEFDARLCEADCAVEERTRPAPRPLVLPVARVVEMNGVVGAGRAGESVRLLVPGAMLNEGDAVAVGRGGSALLVFRDGARVALAQNSRFAINRFRYSEAQPREGSAFLTLYDGYALVSTGQLAKISPDAFLFRSALGVARFLGSTGGFSGCLGAACVSGSVSVSSDGVTVSGGASAGGASATGETTVDSGGVSGSGSVTVGNNTASGSTGTAKLNLPGGQQVLSNAEQLANEVVDGVRNITAVVVSTVGNQNQNFQQQVGNVVTQTQNTFQNTTQVVTNAAVDQAVNALNTATAPIVAEMTALLTQMRNNPPQTEAAAQQLSTRVTQLSQLLTTALNQARTAAGAVAQNDAFRASYGLAMAEYLTFNSVLGAGMAGTGGTGGSHFAQQAMYDSEINRILADPYALGSIGLVGLSAGDLIEARNAGIYGGSGVIQREIASHLASQGSAAAKSFFNEAQSTATTFQQRAAEEAARVAAEAERIAAAAKVEAEAKFAAQQKIVEEKLARIKALAVSAADRASSAMKELHAVLERIKGLPADGAAAETVLAQARKDLTRISAELNAVAALTADPQLRSQLRQLSVLATAVILAPGLTGAVVAALAVDAIVVAALTTLATTPAMLVASAMLLESVGMQEAAAVLRGAAGDFPDTAQTVLVVRSMLLSLPATAASAARRTVENVLARLEQDATRLAAQSSRAAADAKFARAKTDVQTTAEIARIITTFTANKDVREAQESLERLRAELSKLGEQGRILLGQLDRLSLTGGDAVAIMLAFLDGMRKQFSADRGGDATSNSAQTSNSEKTATDPIVVVHDGAVEIIGRGRVLKGEMLAATGGPMRMAGLATVPDVKVDPDLFKSADKAVDEGLYVWVRDGAVRVTKDAESVDVAAGNAAVVTDHVRLLDVVPNFMRFDGTPRPLPSGSGSVIDTFRAGDGAILNMCSVR